MYMKMIRLLMLAVIVSVLVVSPAFANDHNSDGELAGVAVEWFGAKGDGKTDDTVAINEAIRSLSAGDTLLMLSSHGYFVEGLLNISGKNDISIIGSNTNIYRPSSADIYKNIFRIVNSKNIKLKGFTLESTNDKKRIIGRGSLGSNIFGIHTSNVNNLVVEDVNFINLEYGVKIHFSENITLNNVTAKGCPQPFYCMQSKTIKGRDWTFDRTGFDNIHDHHIYINTDVSDVTLSHLHFTGGAAHIVVASEDVTKPCYDIYMSDIILKGVSSSFGIACNNVRNVVFNNIFGDDEGNPEFWFHVFHNSNDVIFTNFKLGKGRGLLGIHPPAGNVGAINVHNGVVELTSHCISPGTSPLLNLSVKNIDIHMIGGSTPYLLYSPSFLPGKILIEKCNVFYPENGGPVNRRAVNVRDGAAFVLINDCSFINFGKENPFAVYTMDTSNPANVHLVRCLFKGFADIKFRGDTITKIVDCVR